MYEGNMSKNHDSKGIKSIAIHREIRKKMHIYLSSDSIKKLDKYTNFVQPEDRELPCSDEPKSENREPITSGSNSEDKSTQSEQLNESHNMEL